MRHFQGYLRCYSTDDAILRVRLFAGTLDPEPEDEPVCVITVQDPVDLDSALRHLEASAREDAWLYLSQSDDRTMNIESEDGTEYQIQGRVIEALPQAYGPDEWEWLARRSHAHARDLNESLTNVLNRLNRTVELVAEQQARIHVKSLGHDFGTTARTLYEQHAEFLARLRAVAEA